VVTESEKGVCHVINIDQAISLLATKSYQGRHMPSARVVTLTFDIQLHCGNGRSFVLELGRPISPANALGCEVSS
jgi:hypothetical protein